MTTSELKTKLQNFMSEIWNQGDFTHLDSYIAQQYSVFHDPGDPWDGKTLDQETFHTRVMYTRNAFPDVFFDLHEMIEEEDRIAVRWTMSGTHTGDLPTIKATHRPFKITGMTFYYFEEGKIIGHRQAFDQLSFLAQIGVLKLG